MENIIIKINQTLKLDGLYYLVEANDILFLLHGWQDNCESFRSLFSYLSQYAIYIFDLPGHGQIDWRADQAQPSIIVPITAMIYFNH